MANHCLYHLIRLNRTKPGPVSRQACLLRRIIMHVQNLGFDTSNSPIALFTLFANAADDMDVVAMQMLKNCPMPAVTSRD